MSKKPYNPLDKENLGKNIALAFINETLRDLPPSPSGIPFNGAGVYAVYYEGTCQYYSHLIKENKYLRRKKLPLHPIYVGKAIPKGSRRGGMPGVDEVPGSAIHSRLLHHAGNIEKVEKNPKGNLRLADFQCRYLLVDDAFIGLAERSLIRIYRPIWNVVIDGFGNNRPGRRRESEDNSEDDGKETTKKRTGQAKSQWDTLHPGREWAERLPEEKSVEVIIKNLRYFFDNKPYRSVDHRESGE